MKNFFYVFLFSGRLFAGLCPSWSESTSVGALDSKFLPESSGLAFSRAYPNRLYHHNDSDNGPYFYVTSAEGSSTKEVEIEDFESWDMEDMSLGPCEAGSKKTCLYLADMGDNDGERESIQIVLVEEKKKIR